jgi:glutamate synthase domain-containing protein 1
MCGIVGLLLKKPELRERLGELAMPMLIGMTERGPDSAGLAVFTGELAGMQRKYSFCAPAWEYDWAGFESSFIAKFGGQVTIIIKGNHAVLTCSAPAPKVRSWAKQAFPQLHVLAAGRLMDIYKDVGSPADVAVRYEFE